jgi:hypothetical protein
MGNDVTENNTENILTNNDPDIKDLSNDTT